jgi:hypothetical protein
MAEFNDEIDEAVLQGLGMPPVDAIPLSDLHPELDERFLNPSPQELPEGEEYPVQYKFGGGPNQEADPDGVLRTQAIIRDIYARHGINPKAPLADAAQHIATRAELDQSGQSMWANPAERADAQYEYAAAGRTKDEVARRLNESHHLMDPATTAYHRDYVRDQDFLMQLLKEPEVNQHSVDEMSVTYNMTGPHQEALEYWDRTRNESPLWSDYHRHNDNGAWIAHALTDPDTTLGSTFAGMEQFPDFLRFAGSGESDGVTGAWRDMRGVHRANQRYRTGSPAPIGNLPSGASVEARQEAIRALKEQVAAASIPGAGERWARTTGWVPPEWMQNVSEGLISTLDPTFLIPVVGAITKGVGLGARAAGAAAKGAGRRAALGGAPSAWGKFARTTASGFGWDQVPEQGVNLGLPFVLDPEVAAKAWSGDNWLTGTTDDEAVKGAMKSDEQLQESQATRKRLYETADPESVSRASEGVQDRLVLEGKLPWGPFKEAAAIGRKLRPEP